MRNWALVAPRLVGRARVVSYDQRGHGLSESPTAAGDYSLALLAGDLCAVLDGLGIERAGLVGHSMGSMVAQTFVLDQPDRVDRLVLVGSTAAALTTDERRWLAEAAKAASEHGMPAAWETHQRLLTDHQRAAMAVDPGLAEIARKEFVRTSADGYAGFAHSAIVRQDLLPRLGEIACPTLVIVGEHDTARLATSGVIANRIPRARLVVIPGAGHSPQLEAPDAFVAALGGFLDDT